MKHRFMLALMAGAFAPTAYAQATYEFQLDENAVVTEEADAPDLSLAEDPNAAEFTPAAVEKPITLAAKTEKPTKAAKPKEPAPEPSEIPIIETKNEVHGNPDVAYVTGGIGEDEKKSIEASKGDYNLHVMSASTSGAFVGDAKVVITRKNEVTSEEMLNVIAGPLLYVRLPGGTYTLDASLGAQKKQQVFTIVGKDKPATVHLGWKVRPHHLSN